ncbi:MAG: 5,6-dimethylbenzimidazole synthase [Rhodopila sp.]
MADDLPEPPQFDATFRHQLEDLIVWRRDVRHFRSRPVPADLLTHLLDLMAATPSVGFSQPARFMLVQSARARGAIRGNFVACNEQALAAYGGARAEQYAALKLAGLDEAPVHLAVFCDEATTTGHGLGRQTMPESLRYSVVAGVQTLWLALRAHGLGLGWVSILDPVRLAADLRVPPSWTFIAYCCIGYPVQDQAQPELQRLGWERRDPAAAHVIVR